MKGKNQGRMKKMEKKEKKPVVSVSNDDMDEDFDSSVDENGSDSEDNVC